MSVQPAIHTDFYKTPPATLKPSRRVLYLDRFNDEYYPTPDAVSGLTSVEAVMAFFKPEVTVVLIDREDVPYAETFQFRRLDDFTPEGLIRQSLYLRVLQAHGGTETALMLPHNLRTIFAETRELEKTYRSVALYFENARATDEIAPSVEFMNVSRDQLDPADVINRQTIQCITDLLQAGHDRFINIANTFALLVLPGALPSRQAMHTWTRIASQHKVLLITDAAFMESVDDLLTEAERDAHQKDDSDKAYTVLTANQAVGRAAYTAFGETEPLYLPLSPLLAGAILRNPIATPAIGSVDGLLKEVDQLRFSPEPADIARFETAGLVVAAMETGRAVVLSDRTLYGGASFPLAHYSVLRAFDWLEQGIQHLLNQRSMENWWARTEKELTVEIMQFLNANKGPRKFLSSYNVPRFIVDPTQRDRIYLEVQVTLNRSATAYTIQCWGESGRDEATGLRSAWKC